VAKTPAYYDDKRCVEESGLDGSTKDMGQCEIHLVIPCFVYGSDVLSCFFNEWDEDETKEAIMTN
jgi:hypothetical protein